MIPLSTRMRQNIVQITVITLCTALGTGIGAYVGSYQTKKHQRENIHIPNLLDATVNTPINISLEFKDMDTTPGDEAYLKIDGKYYRLQYDTKPYLTRRSE